MEGLKLNIFLLSSFGIGLKGSILNILNILFCLIITLFFRHRVLKFDLYLSRQEGKFVSFSLSVLKFGGVFGGGVHVDGVSLETMEDSFSGGDKEARTKSSRLAVLK